MESQPQNPVFEIKEMESQPQNPDSEIKEMESQPQNLDSGIILKLSPMFVLYTFYIESLPAIWVETATLIFLKKDNNINLQNYPACIQRIK